MSKEFKAVKNAKGVKFTTVETAKGVVEPSDYTTSEIKIKRWIDDNQAEAEVLDAQGNVIDTTIVHFSRGKNNGKDNTVK